jgi:hypothetical protein
MKNEMSAELAELVDALDSGSSVRKDFRVQVPGSAFGRKSQSIDVGFIANWH